MSPPDSRKRGPRVRIARGGPHIPVPASQVARMALGVALVIGGLLGFLPILGLWMLPLGLLILSVDLAPVRRLRRRIDVWWGRQRAKRREEKNKS